MSAASIRASRVTTTKEWLMKRFPNESHKKLFLLIISEEFAVVEFTNWEDDSKYSKERYALFSLKSDTWSTPTKLERFRKYFEFIYSVHCCVNDTPESRYVSLTELLELTGQEPVKIERKDWKLSLNKNAGLKAKLCLLLKDSREKFSTKLVRKTQLKSDLDKIQGEIDSKFNVLNQEVTDLKQNLEESQKKMGELRFKCKKHKKKKKKLGRKINKTINGLIGRKNKKKLKKKLNRLFN